MRVEKVSGVAGEIVLGLAVAVLLGCQAPPEPVAGISRPLLSAGFEEGLGDWEVEVVRPAAGVEGDSAEAYSGTSSARLVGEDDAALVILRAPESVPVESGKTYALSFYYKTAPPEGTDAFPPAPSVRVMVFDGEGNALGSQYRRFAGGPSVDGWARFWAEFSLGGPEVLVRPEVWLEREQGSIWVDGLEFGEVVRRPGANLVANGGFESGDAGMPYDWVVHNLVPNWHADDLLTLSHTLRPDVSLRWESRGAHSGRRCLLMERRGEDEREWLRCGQMLTLKGGEQYVISCWAKTEGVEELAMLTWQLLPSGLDQAADQVQRGASNALSGTADWQCLEALVAVPEDSTTYVLRMELVLKDRGKVWFDDVSVRQIQVIELQTP